MKNQKVRFVILCFILTIFTLMFLKALLFVNLFLNKNFPKAEITPLPKLSFDNLWENETSNTIESVAISDDGMYTVSGNADGQIYLFEKNTENSLWSYNIGGYAYALDISSDSNYIAAGGSDNKLYLFMRTSNNPIKIFSMGSTIRHVRLSYDGQYIIAGCSNGNISFYNRDNDEYLWNYNAGDAITGVDISGDGRYIVISSYDDKIYLFNNTASISKQPMYFLDSGSNLMSTAISNDGRYFAATGVNKKVMVFNTSNPTSLWNYTMNNIGMDVSLSSDGSHIVAGGQDNSIYYFSIDSTVIWSHTTGGWVNHVAISADGTRVLASSDTFNAYLFIKSSSTFMTYSVETYISAVALSSFGDYQAFGSGNITYRTYHARNPPGAFILSSNADNPDKDGQFILSWTTSDSASYYNIYVHNSSIYEINNSLTALFEGATGQKYTYTIATSGVYYFAILAISVDGQTLSNCIKITIQIPEEEKLLFFGLFDESTLLLIGLLILILLIAIITAVIILAKKFSDLNKKFSNERDIKKKSTKRNKSIF